MEALLKLPFLFKGLILAWILTTESVIPDANVVLNIATILLIVVFGPRYIKTSSLKNQIKELTSVIDSKNLVISSKDQDIGVLKEDLQGTIDARDREAANGVELKAEVAEWRARYDEQQKYTAEPALIELNGVLGKMHDADAHWQNEMVALNNATVYLMKRLIDEVEGRKGSEKLAGPAPPEIEGKARDEEPNGN